jgi:hypothetical protein
MPASSPSPFAVFPDGNGFRFVRLDDWHSDKARGSLGVFETEAASDGSPLDIRYALQVAGWYREGVDTYVDPFTGRLRLSGDPVQVPPADPPFDPRPSVDIGGAAFGWCGIHIKTDGGCADISASSVFDPFPSLVGWCEALAAGGTPFIEIDEEGRGHALCIVPGTSRGNRRFVVVREHSGDPRGHIVVDVLVEPDLLSRAFGVALHSFLASLPAGQTSADHWHTLSPPDTTLLARARALAVGGFPFLAVAVPKADGTFDLSRRRIGDVYARETVLGSFAMPDDPSAPFPPTHFIDSWLSSLARAGGLVSLGTSWVRSISAPSAMGGIPPLARPSISLHEHPRGSLLRLVEPAFGFTLEAPSALTLGEAADILAAFAASLGEDGRARSVIGDVALESWMGDQEEPVFSVDLRSEAGVFTCRVLPEFAESLVQVSAEASVTYLRP